MSVRVLLGGHSKRRGVIDLSYEGRSARCLRRVKGGHVAPAADVDCEARHPIGSPDWVKRGPSSRDRWRIGSTSRVLP